MYFLVELSFSVLQRAHQEQDEYSHYLVREGIRGLDQVLCHESSTGTAQCLILIKIRIGETTLVSEELHFIPWLFVFCDFFVAVSTFFSP